MISRLLAGIQAIFQDSSEARYFAAGDAAGHALDRLGTGHRRQDRVVALLDLAEAEQAMAENAHTFADAEDRDDDNLTLAEVHAMAARLARLVAGTELPSQDCKRLPYVPSEPLAEIALPVLHKLAMARVPLDRARHTVALCEVLVDAAGGQACEILAAIAKRYRQLAGVAPGQDEV